MAARKNQLIRDPEDWARDWGWVSRRRAKNVAAKLENLAQVIDGAMGDDEGAKMWCLELRSISKIIAPAKVPAERKAERKTKQAKATTAAWDAADDAIHVQSAITPEMTLCGQRDRRNVVTLDDRTPDDAEGCWTCIDAARKIKAAAA